MINEFKEDTNKQLTKLRNIIQNMKEQFNNESLKKNQTVILKIDGSINQIKTSNLHLYTNQIMKDYLGLKKYHYIKIIKKKTKK